jgi:uncharacterized NAD(P)/FAD-binding protein YdhS
MLSNGRRTIAIIGAGFSGSMVAIHLRHALPPDHDIILFERSGRFACGAAYAPSTAPLLLNVRSSNMSALPDVPGHFDAWLAAHPQAAQDIVATEAGTFATRRLYGRYLRDLLRAEMLASGGQVRLSVDEVKQVVPADGGYRLVCGGGQDVACAGVVLALGNLPQRKAGRGTVFDDPWTDSATADLRAGSPVLILGTGLTMVDLALSMHARGFGGPILALSRRGLTPSVHAAASKAWALPDFTAAERRSLPALLRRVRQEVRDAQAAGVDWRAVIDSLRPATAALWQGLPEAERRRFLRHLRPFWDTHRHRLAPSAADRFAALRASGALSVRRGRLLDVSCGEGEAVARLRFHGEADSQERRFQRVIYATGVRPAGDHDALVRSLTSAGLARTDVNGIGLRVSPDLALLGPDGQPSPGLWALGPIVQGTFWECTAVPDIRRQAKSLAEAVTRASWQARGAEPAYAEACRP